MLEICKASAGSGKTYKLTGDYIVKLFRNGERDGYKHILAVTFTNKATDEMKQRILEKLYSLATTSERDTIFDNIMAVGELQWMGPDRREKYIRESAGKMLIEILNDYSQFNVSTIDKFFQQTMRSFARELGHFASYNVELDTDSVLSETLDLMMDSLSENQELLDWIIKMSVESIEGGEGWNPMPRLKNLGAQLFHETLKLKQRALGAGIADKDAIEKYRMKMGKVVHLFEQKSRRIGEEGCSIINDMGLSADSFAGGSRSPFKHFEKWADGEIKEPTATFAKLRGDVGKWYAKSAKDSLKNTIIGAYNAGLDNLVCDAVELYTTDFVGYNTAKVISHNLFTLGVLGDIYEVFQNYCREKNIVLLSETNDVLNRIIDGSDTPFVYEKMGVWLDHYLIDEFQDTSQMQWANILPLVRDSADKGLDNLIVGDVKQSIYRWRNSDWSLLNERIYKDFEGYDLKDGQLSTNRRSLEEVVNFNNSFFKQCAVILQSEYNVHVGEKDNKLITGIYDGDPASKDYFCQEVIESKMEEGHVKVSFVGEDGDRDWREVNLDRLVEDIRQLRENGWSYKDMAVLVRTNKEGSMVAESLLAAGYKIVSDDSLIISTSASVQKIVTALKYISAPEDPLVRFVFNGVEISTQEKTLYNICEDIARQMPAEDMVEGAFIQAFMDSVLDYASVNGSDVEGFLKWWDDAGRKRSISAPEGDDAIRIITIHKAKGLGFEVVLVPFFDEPLYDAKIEDRGKILWCTPKVAPFDEIKLLPVASSSRLLNTMFADDYKEEVLYSYIDKINVAYVAFTRAKSELLLYPKLPDFKKDGSYDVKSMADVLYFYCGEETEYEEGVWMTSPSYGNTADPTPSIPDSAGGSGPLPPYGTSIYHSIPVGERLQLTLRGGDFFSPESSRGRGVVMHDILAKIATEDDLDRAVDEAVSEGLLSSDEKIGIKSELHGRLDSVASRHWFDGTYDFRNETDILLPNGDFRRPDRVMVCGDKAIVVDYKFGQLKRTSYIRQVQQYMSYLTQMGYTSVEGYVWYLEDNEMVQV